MKRDREPREREGEREREREREREGEREREVEREKKMVVAMWYTMVGLLTRPGCRKVKG